MLLLQASCTLNPKPYTAPRSLGASTCAFCKRFGLASLCTDGVRPSLRPQVVVDTAEAGKALLARGKLRNRVTLIPLDKVRAARVSGDLMSQVAGSSGGMAKP